MKKALLFLTALISSELPGRLSPQQQVPATIKPRMNMPFRYALETPSVTTVKITALDTAVKRNLVTHYGAVGDGVTDNFNALQQALTESATHAIELTVPNGFYYVKGKGNLEMWPLASKGLRIKGSGNAVFLPENNRTVNKHEYYFMRLQMAPHNAGVEITGITIDGSKNPQDLYFTMNQPSDIGSTPMCKGFIVHGAQLLSMHSVNFQHMYGGYCLLAEEYSHVNVQNVNINDVGGDDITESFGMGLYFGGHTGDATINIDNVYMDGKVSPRNPEYTAWIGVVLENGTIQLHDKTKWLLDKNTYVNITNSIFWNVETTFHVETVAGNVYWNSDNVKTRCKNYFVAAGINGQIKERSHHLDLAMMPWKRMGIINGMYYSEKERTKNVSEIHQFAVHNSRLEYLTMSGVGGVSPATSYGDSNRSRYYNTTLINVPDVLVVNASAYFHNSQINLHPNSTETASTLAGRWFSVPAEQKVEYNNTSVNASGNHKTATEGPKPAKVANTGYVAPELTSPMAPPI